MRPGLGAMEVIDGELREGSVNPVEQALVTLHRLLEVGAADQTTDWVIFGSAVLYLHGLREPDTVGDIDAFVTPHLWGHLLALAPNTLKVATPRAGDPPFLVCPWSQLPVHLFYDWTARDEWLTADECFASAEDVNGWRCISLELLRKHKQRSGTEREKHVRDLEVLNEYLGGSQVG